jgi:aminoglycoside 2''-phosphotransferase
MSELLEYASRLAQILPGTELSNIRLCSEAGVGTDAVFIDERFIALFCTNPVCYTAPRNAEICRHIRQFITVAIPEAVVSREDVVVFTRILGVPLERQWLLRQTEAVQQTLADQLGGFLRELHALPVRTFDGIKLPDYSTSISQYKQKYDQIQKIVFPELLPSAVSWARDHCETFLNDPQACEVPTFQHTDLVPSHILVDQETSRLSGILDFGSGGIGDPAVDLSMVLLFYGECFAARLFKTYPESQRFADRARFLAGMMYLQWICTGIKTNERKWFLHHLNCARDLLPTGTASPG